MKPFQQGQLDGLCGVYSIINSVKLIKRQNVNVSQEILKECISVLVEKKGSSSFIINGIVSPDISFVLREIIKERFSIKSSKPFHRCSKVPLNIFWGKIQEFMAENPLSAIICGVGGDDWNHWTVIRSITDTRVCLFDSYHMVYLYRKRCTTSLSNSNRPYQLHPSSAFFLTDETCNEGFNMK